MVQVKLKFHVVLVEVAEKFKLTIKFIGISSLTKKLKTDEAMGYNRQQTK